jgi:hypothetical protein
LASKLYKLRQQHLTWSTHIIFLNFIFTNKPLQIRINCVQKKFTDIRKMHFFVEPLNWPKYFSMDLNSSIRLTVKIKLIC